MSLCLCASESQDLGLVNNLFQVAYHILHVITAAQLAQAPVVRKLDSAFYRINHYPEDKYYDIQLCYPVDSAIHLSNNWGQWDKCRSAEWEAAGSRAGQTKTQGL